MTRFRKTLSALTIATASVTAGWFGYQGVMNVQFAHAEQQVEATRQQLKNADDLSTVFRSVGKVVGPSVVQIQVHKTVHGARRLPIDPDTLRKLFPQDQDGQPQVPDGFGNGDDEGGGDQEQVGTGSGVIVDVDGDSAYIVTNNHVAGGATEMTVTLADGREIKKAKVVGADPKSDLAVVKIEADRLIAAKWGDSDELQKGDWILAFGSPFEYIGSMTHGIVSALNRTSVNIIGNGQGYENFIQVDAPINPGNSGGPLVNVHGEVVGINTAIASRSGSFSGIGFAIPSNQAKAIYATLKEKGKITRGWLGVQIRDVGKEMESAKALGYTGVNGVLIDGVLNGTPAYGKLKPSDIVEQLNGKPVTDMQQLRNAIAQAAPNTEVSLKVFRDGKEQDVAVKLGEQPEDAMAALNGRNTPDKRQHGDVAADKFGLKLQDVSEELAQKYNLGDVKSGALITQVAHNSLAERYGLKAGVVITKVNRKAVTSAKEAGDALAAADLTRGVHLIISSADGESSVFLKNAKGVE